VHVSVTFFALVRSITPFRTVDTLFVYACTGIHDDVIRTRDTRGKLHGNWGGVGWLSILRQSFADEMFDKLGVCHIALIQVGKIHPQVGNGHLEQRIERTLGPFVLPVGVSFPFTRASTFARTAKRK